MNQRIRHILTSHSIDNLFDYCPRKFEFLNLFDKRPPRESGFAASVGTALHEGTQAWLISRAEGESPKKQLERCFMALFIHYPWDMQLEEATSRRDIHETIALQWAIITDPSWADWDLLWVEGRGWAVEVPFMIRHTSLGTFPIKHTGETAMLVTQGKIDFILQHKVHKHIRTRDLKTTIKDMEMIESEYTFSGQQTGYDQVLKRMLGESKTSVSGWNPNTVAEYDYMIAKFGDVPHVEVLPMEKDQEFIDDYWFGKMDRLNRIKAYAASGWFPRTNGGCNTWGNVCSCFDVCKTRDYSIVRRWFDTIDAEPQQGYDYWVEMDDA